MVDDRARYRRLVELGRGGMAVVHLAAMRSSYDVTKLVVVKELHPNLAADPEFRSMFLDEARLAARLNHPNVVQTFEIVDHIGQKKVEDGLDGVCALVMEYLEGQPLNRLRSRLKQESGALGTYLAILCDALTGLEYAHNLVDYEGKPLNIVHRDVSPHNIFITYSGEVKVLDFGIAKANDSASAPTQVGTVKGKVAYMAPEQARGDRVDARTDVFAVGVMLWEAVVGRRLWAGHPEAAILYKLESNQIPSPREARADVPEALEAICMRALAHDPAQRHASAAELRDAVEAFAATLPNKPSRRALGETMTKLFVEERSEVRRVVEEQLGRAESATTDQFATPGPTVKMHETDSSSSLQQVGNVPTGSTRVTVATSVMPGANARLPLIAGAIAVTIAAIAIAIFIRSHSSSDPASHATTTNANATVSDTTSVAPAASSRRMLAIDPPTALVTVDGKPLASGTTFVEGVKPVAIHAEAPGFAPLDATIDFDTRDPFVVRLAAVSTPHTSAPSTHTPTHPTHTPPIATTHGTSTGATRPTASPTDVGY
jgi:serine/threonine-protein kinase